jgi:hypothetical protein
MKCQQTMDNTIDGHWFECNQLWEDLNHAHRCPCKTQCTTCQEALDTLRQHLQKQHTPDIMATLICDSMSSWLNCTCILPPTWTPSKEPIMTQLTCAFKSQSKIGWDQFFFRHIAKDWKLAIKTYYHEWQPGDSFNPDQWMQTTIEALWKFTLTLWQQWNATLHGPNSALTLLKKIRRQSQKQQQYIRTPLEIYHLQTVSFYTVLYYRHLKLNETTFGCIPGNHWSGLCTKPGTQMISLFPGLQHCMSCGLGVIWYARLV